MSKHIERRKINAAAVLSGEGEFSRLAIEKLHWDNERAIGLQDAVEGLRTEDEIAAWEAIKEANKTQQENLVFTYHENDEQFKYRYYDDLTQDELDNKLYLKDIYKASEDEANAFYKRVDGYYNQNKKKVKYQN